MLAGLLSAGIAGADEPTVKVGAIEDLSGPTARYGAAITQGFQLAVDQINAKGGVLGGKPIEFLVEDAAGQKDQAIAHLRRAIELSERTRQFLEGDSDLDPIREDPAFKELFAG